MMTKARKEIIERTMANLDLVDNLKKNQGPGCKAAPPYEVTQLVNSFLMTLLQNWDVYRLLVASAPRIVEESVAHKA